MLEGSYFIQNVRYFLGDFVEGLTSGGYSFYFLRTLRATEMRKVCCHSFQERERPSIICLYSQQKINQSPRCWLELRPLGVCDDSMVVL